MPSKPASPRAAAIAGHIATLRALLRLVDPASPFQPILLGSVDLFAWLALFSRTSEALRSSLKSTPSHAHQFFRLVYTLCEPAEVFAFPPDDYRLEDAPEVPPFWDTSAMCEEDATAIEKAIASADATFATSTTHRDLILRTLGLRTTHLKETLSGRGGLISSMKQACRASRPFGRNYKLLVAGLEKSLNRLAKPSVDDWSKPRFAYATLRHQLTHELRPRLDGILATIQATEKTIGHTGPGTSNALRKRTRLAIEAFLGAHALARSIHDECSAVQYYTLFQPLLGFLAAELAAKGICPASPIASPRIIDDIRKLPPNVIDKRVLADWEAALPEADKYATEVVLAALHHLETSSGTSLIYGFSDNDLATWIRSGEYAGADPLAERSKTKAAEKKRVARTLQHLLPAGAAFHDRRLWTPPHRRNSGSSQHRLWTVNPLLALLPRIAARLASGIPPASSGDPSEVTARRPTPTHRNRGTQPSRRSSGA